MKFWKSVIGACMGFGIWSSGFYGTAQADDKWNTSKSTHFIVYYKNAGQDFIETLVDKSEGYYDEIAYGLGFTRYNFWLWDNRARVYIYDTIQDYQSATAQPAWSAGVASPREKTISTFVEARGFFDGVLAHEMGHIIFREFVGFSNPAVPVWLDEAVASYQEKSKSPGIKAYLKEALKNNSLIPLPELTKMNPQFLTDDNFVQLFYAQAFSIIDYLIRDYGKDSFVLFCQDLRDKLDLERAIRGVYPFSNLGELEAGWRSYLKKK